MVSRIAIIVSAVAAVTAIISIGVAVYVYVPQQTDWFGAVVKEEVQTRKARREAEQRSLDLLREDVERYKKDTPDMQNWLTTGKP